MGGEKEKEEDRAIKRNRKKQRIIRLSDGERKVEINKDTSITEEQSSIIII